MRNLLFTILGIIIVASLIFLLGYLVGRGYDLGEVPMAKKVKKEKVISKGACYVTKEEALPFPFPRPDGKPLTGYTVQIASSQREEKALALVNRLKTKDYSAYIEEAEIEGKKWFRVRIGLFKNRGDAQKLANELKEREGLKEAMVWKR